MVYSKEELKERYRSLPQVIESADQYTQKITAYAYRNPRLVANQVLCRNPHINQFFKKMLFQERPKPLSSWRIAWNIFRYYIKSLVRIAPFLTTFISERVLFRSKFNPKQLAQTPRFLVDTYLLVEKLFDEEWFKDYYLGGIYKVLQKYQKPYLLLPRLYGRRQLFDGVNPFSMRRIIRILRKSGHPTVTEFQLLSWADLFDLLRFIVLYPFDVLKLAANLDQNERVDQLFRAELHHTLPQVNFQHYARYLAGRRLGQLFPDQITLLSWNENQTIEKNLYKGLRETSSSIVIWGCQFFIGYPPLIHAQIAPQEAPWGVTPDCVLVNGSAYLKTNSPLEYRPGVSMRYAGVFDEVIPWNNKQNTVLFLTHPRRFNRELIDQTSSIPFFRDRDLIIHPHPGDEKWDVGPLPKRWQLSYEDRYELLAGASLVITSESGVAVEAAALGTSVIILASQESFTCNPMLPTGQGEIWDIAFDGGEIEETYHRLEAFRSQHPNRLRELSMIYRDQCFIEPTEENIVQAFHLRN
jgi:hypothetical protein